MLRKKFVPPVAFPNRPTRPASRDRTRVPERNLTLAALKYHFALRWLDRGSGALEHFVLLAQHLVIARALEKLGCRGIPEPLMVAADEALTKWTRHGLTSGEFRIDSAAFTAIQAFLLAHDEQLKAASGNAVAAAVAELNEVCNAARRPAAGPLAVRVANAA
jgi:hypothetical protein